MDNQNRLPVSPKPIISPADLLDLLLDDDVVIIDCRFDLADPGAGEVAFGQSRIPGAHYAHLDRHLSSPKSDGTAGRHPLPSPEVFATFLESCGVHDDTLVVAYDSSGGAFASRLWWLTKWLGHDAVSVLDGGWPAWIRSGGPVEEVKRVAPLDDDQPASIGLTIRLQNQWLISADELSTSTFRIVDSRAAVRYSGQEEPIDPVAGHIPGAINRPWMDNLDENGVFLPESDLGMRFGPPDERTDVFYCGSGVTACHNILASVVAGRDMPLLYAPSWSGWISDPNRPIETSKSENPGG